MLPRSSRGPSRSTAGRPARRSRGALAAARIVAIVRLLHDPPCISSRDKAEPSEPNSCRFLQLRGMRFADEYVGLHHSADKALSGVDRQQRVRSAQGPELAAVPGHRRLYHRQWSKPFINVVDMVVLATLSRMVIDDAWGGERFGERAAPLRDAYHRLEPLALEIAKGVLPPDQIAELQQRNSRMACAKSTCDCDFVCALPRYRWLHGQPRSGGIAIRSAGFSHMLGLDPFSSLDPAVREITQSQRAR